MLKSENSWKCQKIALTNILEAPEKLKKNDGQDSAMVLDKIEIEVTEKMAVEQWKITQIISR